MGDVATPGIVTSPEILSCYGMSDEVIVKSGVQIWPGEGVAVDVNGQMVSASDATALLSIGRACSAVLGDGTLTCRYDQGIFRFTAGTNPPLAANRGQPCYWQDNQTLTMTPGTLVAGVCAGADSQGPRVLIGLGLGGDDSLVLVPLLIADLVSADAAVYYCTSPVAGQIVSITSILQGHALATGNATLTGKIGAAAITGGVLTLVNAASAVGDVVTVNPTAANTVAVGSKINFTVGGTQTNAAAQANLLVTIAQ